MRAEQYLPQEDKIKYVLNGETRYYTMDELREYYKELLINNNVYLPNCFDDEIEELLKTLEKYDGDPYGDENLKWNHDYYHRIEAMGMLEVIP